MLGARRIVVDWVEVGRAHAIAAWDKWAPIAIADGVCALERVPNEADAEMLRSVYGQVDAAQWSAYRNAYRSTLHAKNLGLEAVLGKARKMTALRAVVAS
jgi:hypothetical protein